MEEANNIIGKTKVCKYYLENKCRFGDECTNRHEGKSVQTVVKKKICKTNTDENKCEKGKKKPPMKTAQDVIQRLQWDPRLPQVKWKWISGLFIIGYLDHVHGVVEKNWDDLASGDNNVFPIPQHKIQYFK